MPTRTQVYVHTPIDPVVLFHQTLTVADGGPTTRYTHQPAQHPHPAYLFTHDFDQNLLATPTLATHPHWSHLTLDTRHGYQDDHGGTALLHAHLVGQLGRWLDSIGATWSWREHTTGHLHHGPGRYAPLTQLHHAHPHPGARYRAGLLDRITTPPTPHRPGTVLAHQNTATGTYPQWRDHPDVAQAVQVLAREFTGAHLTQTPDPTTPPTHGYLVCPLPAANDGWVRVHHLDHTHRPRRLALYRRALDAAGWATATDTGCLRAARPGTGAHHFHHQPTP